MTQARTATQPIALAIAIAMTMAVAPALASPHRGGDEGGPPPRSLQETITLKALLEMMREGGWEDARIEEEKGVISWAMAGGRSSLISLPNPSHLSFYAYGKSSAGLDAVNAWNRGHKSAKVYLDDGGDMALELDLDLRGGVARERILSWLAACEEAQRDWLPLIEDNPPD